MNLHFTKEQRLLDPRLVAATPRYETFITQGIDGNGFKVLAIEPRHTAILTTMPFHHRDPFDRLIVAQAQAEKVSVVSNDSILDRYGISWLW